MQKLSKILFVMLLLLILVCGVRSATYAAVPHLINYQGRLTDSSGAPLNGSYSLTFRIYDAEAAGNLLWEETQQGVVIQKGIFSILLGSVTNLDLPFDKPYYLEIKVGNEVMSPRQTITAAGYAIRAERTEDANTVGGVGISNTPTPNKILPLDSNAKLPASALNLKAYDSGWFPISLNSNYTKTHNLGTTKVIVQLWFSPNPDGSPPSFLVRNQFDMDQDGRGSYPNGCINGLTTTTISLSTPGTGFYQWVAVGLTSATTIGQYTSGYYRIIMLALE